MEAGLRSGAAIPLRPGAAIHGHGEPLAAIAADKTSSFVPSMSVGLAKEPSTLETRSTPGQYPRESGRGFLVEPDYQPIKQEKSNRDRVNTSDDG